MGDSDSYFVSSFIGEDTKFRGDITLSGLLRIDGDFAGSVSTTGKVIIGKTGRAECVIQAKTVVVGGIVKGNIFATEKVVALSSGIILGNISAPRLIAENGVILNGKCVIIEEMANQSINGKISMYTTPDFSEPEEKKPSEDIEKYNPSKNKDETISAWNQ